MPNSKIIWDSKALEQFSKIVKYIAKDSLLQAENVRTDIIKKIDSLANSPAMYAPDKYKENNDGSYRAFELHRLRIAYHVSGNEIRILRVRSTYQEPLQY